jgi:hypothetical protein
MKKFIPLTLLAVLFGGVAYANGHDAGHKSKSPCMKPGKVLTKDVDLTPDQRALAEDLKAERTAHKEDRHELKRSMKQDRIDTLKGYAAGDLSRSQVNAKIEDKHTEMIEKHADMKAGFLALIDSYDEAQKDQVRSNLEETRQCMEESSAQFDEHRENKTEHMQKRAEKKAEFLTKDLELSRNQQAAFDAWQAGQQERFHDRMGRHMDKAEHLEALLDGQSTHSLERAQEERAEERLETMLTQAGLMMDFVDSLDNNQRDQFIENIDVMVERAENRKKDGHHGKGSQRR